MNSSSRILVGVRHVVLTLAFLLGATALVTASFALVGGSESLAGRATVLLVNKFWIESLGDSGIYAVMFVIQLFLSVSLVAGVVLTIARARRAYLLVALSVFIAMSIALDVMRIGFSVDYAILMVGKYAVYALLIYLVRASYQSPVGERSA